MSILDFLRGRPLSSREEQGQRIAVLAGIAIFGLDALSSAAYGPEAALTVMRPLGALGNQYLVPISLSIIALLTIVFFSYRQTIAAYPGGGGSYTVARENLGSSAGLLAGSALMIEFVAHAVVALGELPESFVGLAVDGELVHHRLEAVGGGREAALFLIQCAHAELAVGQHFLNVAQLLLRQGSELAVGALGHELLAFLLGAEGVHGVAVGAGL